MALSRLPWLLMVLLVFAAGWQYKRANESMKTAAVAAAAHEAANAQHRLILKKVHAANAALRVESDRLATSLAVTQGDIDALLQVHENWSAVPVPDPIAKRLRDYAATARGPPD